MTPRNQRRLGVLVGITLLFSLLGAASAAGSPIQDKQSEAARIQAQLDAQGNRISQLDEQYNRAQMSVASTQASYAKAQGDLAAANARFAQVKSHMSEAAVNAYTHGGNTSMIEQLVKSDGKDLAVRKTYVETAAADQRSALDELRAARQDLEAQQAKLKSSADSAKSAAQNLASQKAASSAKVPRGAAPANASWVRLGLAACRFGLRGGWPCGWPCWASAPCCGCPPWCCPPPWCPPPWCPR